MAIGPPTPSVLEQLQLPRGAVRRPTRLDLLAHEGRCRRDRVRGDGLPDRLGNDPGHRLDDRGDDGLDDRLDDRLEISCRSTGFRTNCRALASVILDGTVAVIGELPRDVEQCCDER